MRGDFALVFEGLAKLPRLHLHHLLHALVARRRTLVASA
jgi:hypothetical protein